jgi:hypothetical protein
MSQPASSSALAPVAVDVAVDALAAQLISSYVNAEQDLLDAVARIARKGLDAGAERAQIEMLTAMHQAAQRIVTALRLRSGTTAQRIITVAATLGEHAAAVEIDRAVRGHPLLATRYLTRTGDVTGHSIAAANAVALDLTRALNAVNASITRFADDAYRAAVAEATTRLLLGQGVGTPASAQSRAWTELMHHGVSGFTDRRGRNWNLSTYVEMATRTAVQRAYNASHEARMTAIGIHLFTVASDGHPCPLCQPWEHAVIAASPGIETPRGVHVSGTLDEARAVGLFHPNCKHVLVPYLPGITRPGVGSVWTDADQARYDALQKLRQLERSVRAAKREQAGALDDLSRQRASRRVRALQAQIRGHVERHGLVRRRRREQLDLGNR